MWYKVCPVYYKTASMKKSRLGLYIARRKTNTFKILDKDMNEVHGPFKVIETIESTRGTAFFNLNPKWLPYQH